MAHAQTAPVTTGESSTGAPSGESSTGAPSGETTPPADSEDATKAQARIRFREGVRAYEEKRYKDALDYFIDANQIYPSPILTYNAAKASEALGDTAGALRMYREYLRGGEPADRERVAERISALEQRLSTRGVQQVTILSKPDGAIVILDGRPVGVTPWTAEIFPGKHRVTLKRDGYVDGSAEFALLAHRAKDVELELQPLGPETTAAASPAPSSVPKDDVRGTTEPDRGSRGTRIGPITWAALGAGVGVLGGAIFFEMRSAAAEDAARRASVQTEAEKEVDAMETNQTVARVLVGVGGALLVTGGVLLYLDLSSKDGTGVNQAHAGCGPHGCGISMQGSF